MIRAEDKARRLRWKEKWDRWRQLKARQHAGEMLSKEDFSFVKGMDQIHNDYNCSRRRAHYRFYSDGLYHGGFNER